MLCSYHWAAQIAGTFHPNPDTKMNLNSLPKENECILFFHLFLIMCAFPFPSRLQVSYSYANQFIYEIHFCIFYRPPPHPSTKIMYLLKKQCLWIKLKIFLTLFCSAIFLCGQGNSSAIFSLPWVVWQFVAVGNHGAKHRGSQQLSAVTLSCLQVQDPRTDSIN